MRFISQPGNWALLIDLNYCETTGLQSIAHVQDPRFNYCGRAFRFIGRPDSTELIVEIDHGDKEEYHADGSVGVLRWEHKCRKDLIYYCRGELWPCRPNRAAGIQNFCPRIPKHETYDKWYAESGPFEQKVP